MAIHIIFRNKRPLVPAADGVPDAYPKLAILASPGPWALAASFLLHGLLIVSAVIVVRALSEEDQNWLRVPVSVQYLDFRAPAKTGIQYISWPITTNSEGLTLKTAAQPSGERPRRSTGTPAKSSAGSIRADLFEEQCFFPKRVADRTSRDRTI